MDGGLVKYKLQDTLGREHSSSRRSRNGGGSEHLAPAASGSNGIAKFRKIATGGPAHKPGGDLGGARGRDWPPPRGRVEGEWRTGDGGWTLGGPHAVPRTEARIGDGGIALLPFLRRSLVTHTRSQYPQPCCSAICLGRNLLYFIFRPPTASVLQRSTFLSPRPSRLSLRAWRLAKRAPFLPWR